MICFIVTGCMRKSQEDEFSIIKKSLNNLKTYISDVEVELHNNKNVKKFSMKQFYKGEKYRMEIYDVSGKPDKIIVYDGSKSYVYFSKVNQTFIEDNSENIPAYSLVISFINNFKIAGELKKESTTDTYMIEAPIPEGNTFMYNEIMEFSKKGYMPTALKIYDIKGELFADIKYKNFKYNPDINDELFNKGDISTFSTYINSSNDVSVDIKDVYKYSGINPILPSYLPKGYVLANVNIDKMNDNAINLTYLNGNDIIKIIENVTNFDGLGYEEKTSGDTIYYKKDNQYIINKNGLMIKVLSNNNVSSDKIIMILKSFK